MEFGAARPSEREEVLDLLARWYGDRNFFARYNQHDPRFRDDDLCLVARSGAEIAAYARAIRFHGFPMVMQYGYRRDAIEAMVG